MESRFFSALRVLLLVIFAGLLIVSSQSKVAASSIRRAGLSADAGKAEFNATLEVDERRVFDLINRERERKGLSYLEWNPELARMARSYSQQMAQGNFFSHYDASGASVVERAQAMKIKGWSKIGENLFECQGARDFASLSVEKWMKSPGHRQNILDAEYTMSGIGVAATRDGKIYVTQVFIEK